MAGFNNKQQMKVHVRSNKDLGQRTLIMGKNNGWFPAQKNWKAGNRSNKTDDI